MASGGDAVDALAPARPPTLATPHRLLKLRSDAALAERFASGDEAAFDVLYERNRAGVLAVCMGVLGTAHDAEDATQETFTALAVALRHSPPRELRPWLARVARNAAIDVARRRRRGLTADGEVPEVAVIESSGASELRAVLGAIRELPESQRIALLMRELGGHSYLEIATLLEVDEDAVRGLIARARVGLRAYREASEMPCSAARASIEAEPDGRRHDKTVRRHLRGCASCKAYRAAMRDDAKALRAVIPIQAGGLAGGGFAAGGLAAAKGAIVGTGLSQVGAACASVCAVGAVGSFVLIGPLHHPALPSPVAHVVRADAVPRRGAEGSSAASRSGSGSGSAIGTTIARGGGSVPGSASSRRLDRSGAGALGAGGSAASTGARGSAHRSGGLFRDPSVGANGSGGPSSAAGGSGSSAGGSGSHAGGGNGHGLGGDGYPGGRDGGGSGLGSWGSGSSAGTASGAPYADAGPGSGTATGSGSHPGASSGTGAGGSGAGGALAGTAGPFGPTYGANRWHSSPAGGLGHLGGLGAAGSVVAGAVGATGGGHGTGGTSTTGSGTTTSGTTGSGTTGSATTGSATGSSPGATSATGSSTGSGSGSASGSSTSGSSTSGSGTSGSAASGSAAS